MIEEKIITINNDDLEYDRLLQNVGEALRQGRQQAVYAVNSAMIHLNALSMKKNVKRNIGVSVN